MTNKASNFSGFQADNINLHSMKEVVVKLTFIGDGMSGKTQILITFARLLEEYFQKIYSLSKKAIEADFHVSTPIFQNWVKTHGFFLRYGKTIWDIKTVSLDTETVGLEDFEYIFPYNQNGTTYKIRLLGNDVGGQNIFDHFRAVLGKMIGPDDNLIVVFDKSRELSCFNSIEQIKKVLGIGKSEILAQIIYCGNKIDLEKHIQDPEWHETLLQAIMQKIADTLNQEIGEYSFPTLVSEKGKERIVKYKIENNQITFPDLEALIYNSIRESDDKYGTKLLSEANTKALCREIAAQLVYTRLTEEIDNKTQTEEIWGKLRSILFQSRPLAIQYSGGTSTIAENDESTYYGRVRDKWREFGLNLPVSEEVIKTALHQTASAGELLKEMGEYFDTNALSGQGIMNMMDSIIQETITKLENPLTDKKELKRKIKKL
ncbi:MAG: Rab family GTPase [Promethearchaeota archaeon]